MNRLREKTTATLLIAIFMISTFAVVIPVSAADYYFSATVGDQGVSIVVEETETAVTWTIDYPIEDPYDPLEGNGLMTVGLVIALDGDGEGPAFQIHNNDGTTTEFPYGTFLMSPWDPTIEGNWNGWVSGFVNTLVTELDWVTCTGGRSNEDNPAGIFTISIDKSELGDDFHWALNLAIGTGFTGFDYEQMSCPVGNGFMGTPAFDWENPIVDDEIPNYEYAPLVEFKSDFVPGIGKGLDKGIPNDNFAKGLQE